MARGSLTTLPSVLAKVPVVAGTALLQADIAAHTRFDRVAALVDGFETPFGLELLATVHWVLRKEGARGAADAVAQTHAWNERKRRFTAEQITLAHDVLSNKGWLN